MECQQQGRQDDDHVSCGVYAFVFAAMLAQNLNPSDNRFKITDMRRYMIDCIKERKILKMPDYYFINPDKRVHWKPKKV